MDHKSFGSISRFKYLIKFNKDGQGPKKEDDRHAQGGQQLRRLNHNPKLSPLSRSRTFARSLKKPKIYKIELSMRLTDIIFSHLSDKSNG